MNDRYNVTKLLEMLCIREIARQHSVNDLKVTLNLPSKQLSPCRLSKSKVNRSVSAPGWCHSELMREVENPVLRVIKKIFCRTTEEGSRTLVSAGLAGPETHGKYLRDCKIHACSSLVEGKEGTPIQEKVWKELGTKLDSIEPGILKNLDA